VLATAHTGPAFRRRVYECSIVIVFIDSRPSGCPSCPHLPLHWAHKNALRRWARARGQQRTVRDKTLNTGSDSTAVGTPRSPAFDVLRTQKGPRATIPAPALGRRRPRTVVYIDFSQERMRAQVDSPAAPGGGTRLRPGPGYAAAYRYDVCHTLRPIPSVPTRRMDCSVGALLSFAENLVQEALQGPSLHPMRLPC